MANAHRWATSQTGTTFVIEFQKHEMEAEVKLYFRDELRKARAVAFRDAEGFQEILFALERLGITLLSKMGDLGKYQSKINEVASDSPLFNEIPNRWRAYHLPFADLYQLVKNARNDALHQGATARHVTEHAISLALILEDALMNNMFKVSDYMVKDPVCAFSWQPVSLVRQHMLANSFSCLPILMSFPDGRKWCLVTDHSLAQYLREVPSRTERNNRLAKTIEDARVSGELKMTQAELCHPNDLVHTVTGKLNKGPMLVVDEENIETLLGIVSAFDLL